MTDKGPTALHACNVYVRVKLLRQGIDVAGPRSVSRATSSRYRSSSIERPHPIRNRGLDTGLARAMRAPQRYQERPRLE